jgi:superoxide dismutase, Cu-Zn family
MNVSLSYGLVVALSCGLAVMSGWGEAPKPERQSGGGSVQGRSGSALAGFANLKRRHGTLKLFLNVLNAPPGLHAVRLHQRGDCSTPDASSAGPSWTPERLLPGDAGRIGELGNLRVDDSGRGLLTFSSSAWTLGDGGELDLVGRSLVIHQDPIALAAGDSDKRLGCAVLR